MTPEGIVLHDGIFHGILGEYEGIYTIDIHIYICIYTYSYNHIYIYIYTYIMHIFFFATVRSWGALFVPWADARSHRGDWRHLPRRGHGDAGDVWRTYTRHVPWETIGETIGKPWENGGLMGFNGKYPLIMTNIAVENHHEINGKIHYFYGHFP